MSYTPPKASWHLPQFLEASTEAIRASRVNCNNCPVNLACMSSDGGTGYVCKKCRSTAVTHDVDGETHFLQIDCAKHNFPTHRALLTSCEFCTGDLIYPYTNGSSNTLHIRYLATIHARVPVAMRQKLWRERFAHFLKLKENS